MTVDRIGTGGQPAGTEWISGNSLVLEALQHVAELAAGAIESVHHASVMLMTGKELRTVAATDAIATDLDRGQLTATDGPCFVALQRGDVTRITSTPNEVRWPSCRDECLRHGVMSVAAIPILGGEAVAGSLNLYSQDHHGFGAHEIRLARSLAAQAAAIAGAAASLVQRHLSADLAVAISARAVVEQAKGIIIATTRCSAEQAYDVLVRQADHEFRTVQDVAKELVASKVARARMHERARVEYTPD